MGSAAEGRVIERDADGDWIYTTYKEWTTPTEISEELDIDVDMLLEVRGDMSCSCGLVSQQEHS